MTRAVKFKCVNKCKRMCFYPLLIAGFSRCYPFCYLNSTFQLSLCLNPYFQKLWFGLENQSKLRIFFQDISLIKLETEDMEIENFAY